MNIIFDLDGTLIDSRLRLYRLFQDLAPESVLSFEQYWELKRDKISNEAIISSRLRYNKDQVAAFVERWMNWIETPQYLMLDVGFTGMQAALVVLHEFADLHVCTARQLQAPVLSQLNCLNLMQFFDRVMVTEQNATKESLIKAHVKNLSSSDWLVGDTGKDIQVGKSLGMKTCGVLSGFLSKKSLTSYSPDLILNSVLDFPVSLGVR